MRLSLTSWSFPALTLQEFADLIAYLESLKNQPATR